MQAAHVFTTTTAAHTAVVLALLYSSDLSACPLCALLNCSVHHCLQREWMEQQKSLEAKAGAKWPEHIFEKFFVLVSTRAHSS